MKLLSDWIILNLGATLAFMGVRAGFVRVVGWVSGLFARKRDQAIKALSDVVTPVAIGGQAPQPQWIAGRVIKAKSPRSVSIDGPAPVGGYPWPSPVSLQDAVLTKAFAGAAMAHDDRDLVPDGFGRFTHSAPGELSGPSVGSKLAPMVTATRPDGTPDPTRFGSPYGMAGIGAAPVVLGRTGRP